MIKKLKKLKKCLLFTYLLLIPALPVSANDNTTEELWQLIHQSFQQARYTLNKEQDNKSIFILLNTQCRETWDNDAEVLALIAQSEQSANDLGLTFRAGITSEDLTVGNGNDGNTYAELSWDVLRGGYFENDYKQLDKTRQAKLAKLSGEIERLKKDYQCRNSQVEREFFNLEISLHEIKLNLMELVYKKEYKAYFTGNSYLDELFVSEQGIRLARAKLKQFYQDPYWHRNIELQLNPPVVELDFLAIMTAIQEDTKIDQMHKLEKKRIEDINEFQKNSQFRVFLRQEFDITKVEDEGLVAGIRFSTPLTFSNSYEKQHKIAQLSLDARYAKWERLSRARVAYQAYSIQLQNTIKQQYRVLTSQEKLNRAFSYQLLGKEVDVVAAVVRTRAFLDAVIELGNSKKELYKSINNVFLTARVEFNSKYIKRSELQANNYRARKYTRAVHLKSSTFNLADNQLLINILATKSISSTLVHVDDKTDLIKLKRFITMSHSQGIKVPVVHKISKISLGQTQTNIRALVILATLTDDIILATDSLELPPELALVTLLEQARFELPDTRFSFIITSNWPKASLVKISSLVNRIYLNVKRVEDEQSIVELIKSTATETGLTKLVVDLSSSSLNTEYEFEELVELINTTTGVNQFSLEDIQLFQK
jgi:hypothetical protein